MSDMEYETDEQRVTIWLVGGPWDGFEVAHVYDHGEIYEVPSEDLGALMPEPGLPNAAQRALYEPAEDRTLWRFVGWR